MRSLEALSSAFVLYLADPALRAIVLAGVAALALALLRVSHARLRLSVWTGVLYAALAMPMLAWLLPAIPLRLAVLPASFAAAGAPVAPQRAAAAGPAQEPGSRTPTRAPGAYDRGQAGAATFRVSRPQPTAGAEAAGISRTAPAHAPTKARWLNSPPAAAPLAALVIYLAVLLVLAGRLAVGLALGRRLRRCASPVSDRRALRWLEWHSLAMGLRGTPHLAESAAVSVPLTLGVVRPVILLPAGWREWETAKVSAVIAHEVSHVKRKDSLSRALAICYRTLFWFSPLGWWLERHLAELAEQASDEAAIVAGAEPTYYAEVLMSFIGTIQRGQGRVNWQGVSMARGVRVRSRIERVLASGSGFSSHIKGSLLALIVGCGAPVVILTAATRPMLTPSALAASTPAAAQSSAEAPPAPPAPAAPAGTPALAPASPAAPPAPSARPKAGPILPAPPGAPLAPVLAGATPVAQPAPPAAAGRPPRAAIGGRLASTLPPDPAAPAAPPAPEAYAATPAPPAAPAARSFAYAQTPVVRDDGRAERTETNYEGDKEGMDFAIVSGDSQTVSASRGWLDQVESLRRKIGGDFIWFMHDGNNYVIRDAATIKMARALYAPQEELGRRQAALGKEQEELGRQQAELGRQQSVVRVKVPADLAERLQSVEAELRRLGPTASQEDLSRLQGRLGEIESRLGQIQGTAGEEQGMLGAQQGELGAKQGELGRRQGELGEEQGRLARVAGRKMQAILKQALDNGKAERAPQ